MPSILCHNLCKTYHQGEQAIVGLDRVSLTIEAGEFLCLSGPSGSGKTTLLNVLGGLMSPDSGAISIGDLRIDELGKSQLADVRLHQIGFVFQAYNLVPVLSARENVEFVMQVQGVPTLEREQRAMELLAEVGLAGMENRLPAELSGGQQQRVAVARAIVSRPELVLADEPTANLDSHSAKHLMALFRALNEKRGVSFVIATHDEGVMAMCPRLIRMRDGRIVADQNQSVQPGA